MATWAIILADDRDFGGSNLTAEIFVSFRVSLGIMRVGYGQVNHSLVIIDILNKFHLRYTAIVLESHDWWSTSILDLDSAWQSPSHSLKLRSGMFILKYDIFGVQIPAKVPFNATSGQ